MNNFLRRMAVTALIVTMTATSTFASVVPTSVPQNMTQGNAPKYVFYLIGDGLGFSQRQMAEYYLQNTSGDPSRKLVMNTLPVSGINTTHSANSLITDSAAAGTALACGVKTDNGVIAQDAQGNDVLTLIEAAESKGMKTGLVSTARITHATPAAFASHNESRNNENEIAVDFVDSGVDFIVGGGARHFLPMSTPKDKKDYSGETMKSKRKDETDVVEEFESKGYSTYIGKEGTDALKAEDFIDDEKVFGALTYSHLPYEIDRQNLYPELPSIGELTDKAIDFLSKGDEGFFLMVEGGRIDHAAHGNDAVGTIYDTLAFDEVVKSAYEFYYDHPEETLVVVVGDHETGGLGLGMDAKGYFVDMAPLGDVKISLEQILYGPMTYDKGDDKEAYIAYVKDNFGLNDITDAELAKIKQGIADVDAGKTFGYYEYNPAGMAVGHVISERANIFWTTTIHTGTAIPMSAIGVASEKFSGYKDNTEIAEAMADVIDVRLQ